MLAKYPPKVKLELLATLKCKCGVNCAYLGLRGYWCFYSSRGLTSLPWFRSLFLGLEVFSLQKSLWAYLAESFPYRNPFEQHQTWRARHFLIYAIVGSKQTAIRTISLSHSLQLYRCQLIDGVSLLVRLVDSLHYPYQISSCRQLQMEADSFTYNRQLMPTYVLI